MTEREARYLRPGSEVRVKDATLGSVRAVVMGWDRAGRRVLARRYDFEADDLATESEAIAPADVLGRHRRF